MSNNIDLIAPTFDGRLSANNYRLSIRLLPDGYSFCINDLNGNYQAIKYIANKRYTSLADDILLTQPYQSISLYHNTRYTLLPRTTVQQISALENINLITPTITPDSIIRSTDTQSIVHSPATDDIAIQYNITTSLPSTFSYTNQHYIALLIQYLTNTSYNNAILVEALSSQTTIVVRQNGKIVYANTFYTSSTTDSVYYIASCIELLQLDINTPIYIIDTATKDNNISSILTPHQYNIVSVNSTLWEGLPEEMTSNPQLNLFALQTVNI